MSHADPPVVECRGLRVLRIAARSASTVLHGIDARFGPGWTAIVGPNGAGKSTMLRAMAGLLQTERSVRIEGRVLLDGDDLLRPSARWPDARARARLVAWMGQHAAQTGGTRARDIVALGRLPHTGLFGAPGRVDERAIERAMALADCSDFAARAADTLSGGERQRVLLARCLATEAPVTLLDEPTTHLDPTHQLALLRALRAMGTSSTLATVLHDLPLAVAADQLLVLRAGRVHAHGSPRARDIQMALVDAFDGAIHVEPRDGEIPVVRPALDAPLRSPR